MHSTLSDWTPLITGKLGIVLGVATVADILARDELRATVITLAAITALVLYRLKRKFRKEAIRGAWDFIDRNLVELILFAAIAPAAWKTAAALLKNFIP